MKLAGRKLLSVVLLGFWGLWFALVATTNVTDGLKAAGVLPADWKFASGNYDLLVKVTSIYSVPVSLVAAMFVVVIAWEVLAVGLYLRALRRAGAPDGAAAATLAVAVGAALFAGFLLADEIFVAFPTGVGATHFRVLVAQLVTWLVVRAEGAEGARGELRVRSDE